jgi:hypothetical protein
MNKSNQKTRDKIKLPPLPNLATHQVKPAEFPLSPETVSTLAWIGDQERKTHEELALAEQSLAAARKAVQEWESRVVSAKGDLMLQDASRYAVLEGLRRHYGVDSTFVIQADKLVKA